MSATESASLVTAFLALFAWLGWHATAPRRDAKRLREVEQGRLDLESQVLYLQTENKMLRNELKEARRIKQ